MSQERIIGKNNQVIGWINTETNGTQMLIDPQMKLLGWYYPDTNRTITPDGQMVGWGNLLFTLLCK